MLRLPYQKEGGKTIHLVIGANVFLHSVKGYLSKAPLCPISATASALGRLLWLELAPAPSLSFPPGRAPLRSAWEGAKRPHEVPSWQQSGWNQREPLLPTIVRHRQPNHRGDQGCQERRAGQESSVDFPPCHRHRLIHRHTVVKCQIPLKPTHSGGSWDGGLMLASICMSSK